MTTTDKPPFPKNVETRTEANGLRRLRAERGPFDFRATGWSEYGQAGTTIYMAVSSDRGGVSVKLLLEDYPDGSRPLGRTLGGGVAWHNLPAHDDQPNAVDDDCELLPGGKCRPGISYLKADEPAALYDQDGEDAVWDWLEHEYRITYEDKDAAP